MIKALVILAPGFEEMEGIIVIDVLRRAGAEVVVAGTVEGPIEASRKTRHLADVFLGDLGPAAEIAAGYDLLYLPGGQPGTDHLRQDMRVLALVRAFDAAGKTIAAICAAPSVLAAAGVLSGKAFTCHPTAVELTLTSGADPGLHRAGERVVVVENLITGLAAGSSLELAYVLVEKFWGLEKLQAVNKGVLKNTGEGRIVNN
ncbi:MAG: DJ-1/PfpI family protein [Verrucomicrobiae bacterium]|nr:DJ-1/PfpI family protein [Verrucomicrobiae bacterium]